MMMRRISGKPWRRSMGGYAGSNDGSPRTGRYATIARPRLPNFAALQKSLLDDGRANADILGVVQRTITRSLNGTPNHGCPPQFFRFRRHQNDDRFSLSSI